MKGQIRTPFAGMARTSLTFQHVVVLNGRPLLVMRQAVSVRFFDKQEDFHERDRGYCHDFCQVDNPWWEANLRFTTWTQGFSPRDSTKQIQT